MRGADLDTPQNLPVQRDTSLLRVFLGGAVGLFVGSVLGFYVCVFAGQLSQGERFAQVGWLFAGAGLVGGAIGGALVGAFTYDRKPRLFLVTFLPIALLLFILQLTLQTLRSIDQPRQYVLQIEGTPGAEFVGTVLVQGKAEPIRGTIPARYVYESLQLRCAFGLVDTENNEQLGVAVSAGGRHLRVGKRVETGVLIEVASRGYAESVSHSSAGWSRLTRQDVKQLMQDHVIPTRASKPEAGSF